MEKAYNLGARFTYDVALMMMRGNNYGENDVNNDDDDDIHVYQLKMILDKRGFSKYFFIISQPTHMLWVRE